MNQSIQISEGHPVAAYAKVFAQSRRIHIPQFLREQDAQDVFAALHTRTDWAITIIHGDDAVYDVSAQQMADMSDAQKAAFHAEVNAAAARQYEGRYRTRRLSDHGEAYRGEPAELGALSQFLNDAAFIDFARSVTGCGTIDFADAQATCYTPGDFLHPHLDMQPQKRRLFAYVLNFTPRWPVEWGGLLGFIGEDQHLFEAYKPCWNALNLFDVAQLHYVSSVAQFAPENRYSVTGWLRAR